MTKQQLRKIFTAKRMGLSADEFKEMNQRIAFNFFSGLDLSAINVLHTFLPIEKNREPNTWLIIERLKKEYPHVHISVPRVNNETGEIESFFFESKLQLEKNLWGIHEPKHGMPVEPEEISMVLVPMLAFDKKGNRVGYGKGFYDKFLITCKPETIKVGISLFDAVDSISDINRNDIALNYCVTPDTVFSFVPKLE